MEWTTELLRKRFLDFFERRGHKVLPSSSVLPGNDPSLLFTNSGMVQFKNYFLGSPSPFPAVCTSQRCIRAGGKHNDLDDVGRDNYHHTFFEMLGNWSFGSYSKSDAIQYAYEFLVDDLHLDPSRLYVTVYDEMDPDSRTYWSRYFPDDRIISASAKDNFWEMGDSGPCGPCTEIHYDRIGNRSVPALVNTDDPNVLEIWNIVFIEFNNISGKLVPLDMKYIDTGIGLERLLSILMDVDSNYKIDSFSIIINFIVNNCKFKFSDTNSLTDIAFRVIADHSRTLAVCLYDSAKFSNIGVGYVLRRILRRAVRYAHEILGLEKGMLSRIVECAANSINIQINMASIRMIDEEESQFMQTLKRGITRFKRMVELKGRLTGEDVFILYDTYGFPKDLTELMGREENVEINLDGFDECREQARAMSRIKHKSANITNIKQTDDQHKYTTNKITACVIAILMNNKEVSQTDVKQGSDITVVCDRTCYYGEKGGQVGDTGTIIFTSKPTNKIDACGKSVSDALTDQIDAISIDQSSIDQLIKTDQPISCADQPISLTDHNLINPSGCMHVKDTQIINGVVHHIGTLITGSITNYAILQYDEYARANIRANHSSAHILYYFIRSIFPDARQHGSLVDAHRCRFDFNSNKLTYEQIEYLEQRMNQFIKSADRTIKIMKQEEAKQANISLEDEDYTNGVRIVEFTNKISDITISDACSGTHVENTSEIERIRIISEGSIKAGIRRIVTVSREIARKAEELASKMEKRAENGEVFQIEGQIPLIDKLKINNKIEINKKKLTEQINEIVGKYSKKIREKEEIKIESKIRIDGKTAERMGQALGGVLLECKANQIVEIASEEGIHVVFIGDEEILEKINKEYGKGRFKQGKKKGLINGMVNREEKERLKETIKRIK